MQSLRAARRATQRMMGSLQKERPHDMSRAETSWSRRNLEKAALPGALESLPPRDASEVRLDRYELGIR